MTATDSDGAVHMVLSGQWRSASSGAQVQDRRLAVEPIWQDELVLVTRASHPWATTGEASIEMLMDEPFVLREKGSGTRTVFENHLIGEFALTLDRFNVICEMGSTRR